MPRYHSKGLRHSRQPLGFTLIEVVLALVLVAFGLLALSATSARVTREVASARGSVAAALAARNRLEWLMAMPCDTIAGGAATHAHGVREWWTVERNETTTVLHDSVVVDLPTGQKTLVLQSSRTC